MTGEVRVYPDLETLSAAAASSVAASIREAVARSGRCVVALAGGRTPRRMYELLAEDRDVPWRAVRLWWGDEWYVDRDHPASNYRMVRTALLDRVAIPQDNVHPMPTHLGDPHEAAAAYEDRLRAELGPDDPAFDLVLLGMGADGHVASLFPGSPAVLETERWVVAVWGGTPPTVRLTLTLPVLNRARRVDVLVAGEEKRRALRRALEGPVDALSCPASAVRPRDGVLVWWVDAAAAGR